MLRKLIKHEFRATGRVMGPLFLIVLVLAVAANPSLRFLLDGDGFIMNLLGGLLMVAFTIGMIGLVIMSIVIMVNRFESNLMRDEGYIMFTLPASSHQLVCSKIIVSSVWFILTGIVEGLAGLICAFDLETLRQILSSNFFRELGEGMQYLIEHYGLNVPTIALEVIVLGLLSCAVLCLQFYAAMAVGHGAANHKVAMSVLAFFVMQFAFQMVGGIFLNALDEVQLFQNLFDSNFTMSAIHAMMGIGIVTTLLTGAVYYGITTVMLKKRLNLQ